MKRGLALMTLLSCVILMGTGCNLLHRDCNSCGGPLGCRPCKIGWQRGGTDYQRFLSGGGQYRGSHGSLSGTGTAPSGVQSATVGYPFYTTRGPRDFLIDNPPSLGR